MKNKYLWLTLALILFLDFRVLGQIATESDKFLGNVYGTGQLTNFTDYWNQVTPENAGKWGSVEGTRDVMNWSGLDAAYNLAKDNGFPFRMHVLVWGNQQPNWIEDLPPAEQLEEIEEWFSLVAKRYPELDYVEVVNEPLNDPPSEPGNGGGNYIEALGGSGETGWDWILNSFRLARQYFPNASLMINDYNIVGSAGNTQRYREIVELLQAENLIDAIGVQAHAFSTRVAKSTLKNNLDYLAETGLPIIITEMDVDGPTDKIQVQDYQKIFTTFWEHPAVAGVTLWGWKPGMWRTNEGAFLVERDGTERPALLWLRAYVNNTFVSAASINVNAPAETVDPGSTLKFTATIEPENATITQVDWSVVPESGSTAEATISENGLLTAREPGQVRVIATVIDGSGVSGEMLVEISGDPTGIASAEVGKFTVYPNPVTDGSFRVKESERVTLVKVLDLSGNLIKKLEVSGQSSIEIKLNVAPGLYLIQLFEGQSTSFNKLLVK